MLNRLNRIGDSATIDGLRQAGKVFKTPPLLFRYGVVGGGESRFAAIVSGRVSKTAVGRNRLRRQIYEAIRAHLAELKSPVVAMVSARESVAGRSVPFRELEKAVLDFIHHLNPHEK